MNAALMTVLLFGAMVVLLATGLPLAFSLGGVALVFAFFLWGPNSLMLVASNAYGYMSNFVLLAILMFIFMGVVLQYSGLAEALYDLMYAWSGRLRGGLAAGTVGICMAFAAMTGISGPATITMGNIALPQMLDRKYDHGIAMGSVAAGGALGSLIPPSNIMIIYGVITGLSVGKLFAASMLPGIILGLMFIVYILARSLIQPALCPALPIEERADWATKFRLLRGAILPILLIIAVLGSIFTGVATPAEASGIGAIGAVACALIYRRLTWSILRESALTATRFTAMALWIVLGASVFSAVYTALGAPDLISNVLSGMPGGALGAVVAMQVSFFILGCFLDAIGIAMITIPLYLPVLLALGVDPLWFGTLFFVNMEMAYLTPPFGFNLFYMKAVAPKYITMVQIYRAMVPFIVIQLFCLILIMVVPQLVTWLPGVLFD